MTTSTNRVTAATEGRNGAIKDFVFSGPDIEGWLWPHYNQHFSIELL